MEFRPSAFHPIPPNGDAHVSATPLLRQMSVLLTVSCLKQDQIGVNVLPKKLADGESAALTTPMSFTGTVAELDTHFRMQLSALSPAIWS